LGFGALFHDVGKVRLPAELINKPGEYDDEDWRAMQQHPVLGALSLAAISTIDEHHARAVLVAYEHHRALDGSGYPPSSNPSEPNLFSKIVAIADSYDAITSGRVYMKSRVSPDEALRRLLEQNGTRYDSILLRGFVHVLGIFPVGTFVRLNNNEIGVVSANDPKDLYRPVVRILRDASGEPVDQREIQLTATDPDTGEYAVYIAEVITPENTDLTMSEALGLPNQEPQPTGDTSVVK
jgi:HD-GYP domain-containing protein (c-di-GMP phosphodiesterase class II)